MSCVVGIPYLYSPAGELVSCVEPTLNDAAGEFLYLAGRLPTYVVVLGGLAGIVVLLVTALTVKELMT